MIPNDDPRLTRYALGEMNDAERIAFEREMTDADRAEADAIRAVAGTLSAELKTEPLPMRIEGGVAVRRSARPNVRRVLAIAASLAVVGLFGAALLTSSRTRTAVGLKPVGQATLAYSNGLRPALRSPVGDKDGPNVFYGESRFEFREYSRLGTVAERPRLNEVVAGKPSVAGTEGGGKRRSDVKLEVVAADQVKPLVVAQPAPAADPAREKEALAPGQATNGPVGGDRAGGRGGAGQGGGRARLGDRLVVADKAKFDYRFRSFEGNDSFLVPVDADGDGVADSKLVPVDRREAPTADSYAGIVENRFIEPVGGAAVSTFGVDVDTASYANVRRFLQSGQRPPADAIRIEELINYFPTSDAPPTDGRPFATYADVASCPWNPANQLVRVALKAREVAVDKRPPSNLVFLVDVSGSMSDADKLPLVKRGLQRLVDSLGEDDRVAIVVYAGSSGLALPSTNAANKAELRAAIDKLEAGGSTNGGQGIELAYATAVANFRAGGANRVILCTDGDFNVGVVDRGALVELIQQKAKAGVFLSVLGFGRGNLKDDTMESLADKGNGQYAYIDSDREAHKVLVEQASGTLLTVAKDVKIQVEFNPATVKRYRLIGYENRALATQDFNNDLKDAGEIGAGHNVVALYEIEPVGRVAPPATGEPLKYQPAPAPTSAVAPAEGANKTDLLTLKLRFKKPDAPLEQGVSELIERTLTVAERRIEDASPDFQFAAAVAGFGMMLRESSSRGACDWPTVARLAKAGVGADAGGYRAEFIGLVDRAAGLAR